MRFIVFGLGWSTALLFSEAPFAQGETEQVTISDRRFDGTPTASPTLTLQLEDIERLGESTVAGILRKLPQVFSGGANESSAGGTAGPHTTLSNGDSVDLRGLGSGSTLVLINGRRVAPADFGGYPDLSLIPLSAVQKIEILLDGASAKYGADAAAGVVNIVLRDDFNGAELHARVGTAKAGALEKLASQLLGRADATGHLIGSLEYRKRGALDSNDRAFSSHARDPLNLLPEQERLSAFLSGERALINGTEIFGDALWSKRTFSTSISNNGGAVSTLQDGEGKQWSASGGVAFHSGERFRLELDASLSRARSQNVSVNYRDGSLFSSTDNRFSAKAVDLKAEGNYWSTPAGDWRVEGGMQRRYEIYRSRRSDNNADDRSKVSALWSGFVVPLVGPKMGIPGISTLQGDLAGRFEHSTHFRDTFSPKLGVIWAPAEPLIFRFTYGKATRNPTADERDESGNAYVIVPTPDPSSGNTVNVLALTLQNSHLQPEKANTWTTGFDLHLPELAGLSLSATYFNIAFRNRITNPFMSELLPTASRSGSYSRYITWNPSADQISMWTQSPHYVPQDGVDAAAVDVIVDNRLQNIAVMHVNGVDAKLSFKQQTGAVEMNWLLDTEYLTRFDRQVLPGEPTDILRSRIYNPVAFRGHGGLTASYAKFNSALFVNYVHHYQDNRQEALVAIGSFTTLDVNLSYSGPHGMTFGLDVSNLLNRPPPYVIDTVNDVHFDGANASALGRFITLEFDMLR